MCILENTARAAAVAACVSPVLTACAGAAPASPPPVAATAAIASTAPAASIPTGGPHDFDFLEGAWSTTQHRLKARGVGSHDWDEFPAKSCVPISIAKIDAHDQVSGKQRAGNLLTKRRPKKEYKESSDESLILTRNADLAKSSFAAEL